LPAENAAIKAGVHPKKYTDDAIKNFMRQQKAIGLSYDWSRILWSHDSKYYKWNQYFFLKFLEKGLAYRKKSPVNWCPKCNTVLANEQVHNGRCWRHSDTEIEIKSLEQWFLKTTKYAEEILKEVPNLDWPERIKIMQENWIGRSEGTEILFEINKEKWPIFTTRPDTLFGVTFMVVSAQHPKLMELVTKEQKKEVEKFLKKIKSTSEKDAIDLEKEGVFTGSYAINPLSGDKVPVWTGNFVVADYGSGMVMAVPAHDQRDFEFAKKYKIPIKLVVMPVDTKLTSDKMKEAYVGAGNLINSGAFDDLENVEAMEHITKALEAKKLGKRAVNFKLRDWLVSRQRYWGTPIPIVYCDKCGIVPVPEKDLPIELPEDVKFGEGNPLLTNKDFVETKCPKCKGKARRETDTMDTFFDSSWYYLRYCDSKNDKKPFEKAKAEYWMPIDFYTGGAEHACMHLIYARFFTKALRDLGFIKLDEPFKKLFNQGMLHGEDGLVMSKSRPEYNIDPLDTSRKNGADSLRMFLVSMASPDKDCVWSSTGIESSEKLLRKILDYSERVKFGKSSPKMAHKINLAVKKVGEEIENLKYNSMVISLRMLIESLEEGISKEDFKKVILLLAPVCPHIAEELWEKTGGKGFVSLAEWPKADEKKINEKFEQEEKNLDKTIGDVLNVLKIVKEKSGKEGEKVYLYVIPNELASYDADALTKRVGKPVSVFAVNDKKKYDPQGKAGKAKPGKPGIYIE
jgi:leucyl-tRNA synthetase